MKLFKSAAQMFVLLVLASPACLWGSGRTHPVPDEQAAVGVAESALRPIYGRKQVESERPFKARLEGDVWIVSGYLPPDWVGGVAVVRINRLSGRVLSIRRGK
jgi:hypothetical protein